MSGIYIMGMSFNFLLQATRVLNLGNYDETELLMIYDYVVNLDSDILNEYYNSCTIMSYNNDIELYIEIIDALIKIYEEKEEYEKCDLLLKKKEESNNIILNKTTENEHN